MSSPLLLRDGENLSADMIQRILGMQYGALNVVGGVGTGFVAGGVGKINPTWAGAALHTGHMAVSATGSNMILTIQPGWAVVIRDNGTSSYDPRALFAELQASATVTVAANATGSTRNDTVCLKIDLNSAPAADGSNLVSVAILAGAAGGAGANAPSDGNLYLPLANVAVANAATSIANANLTDLRNLAPGEPNPLAARAHQAGAQSIPNSTWTKVNLDTVDYDRNGNWDVVSNHRWTAPAPGTYDVDFRVQFAAATALAAAIYKNGVELSRSTQSTLSVYGTTGSDLVNLNLGDYLELWINQISGGPNNTDPAVPGGIRLAVHFVSPL